MQEGEASTSRKAEPVNGPEHRDQRKLPPLPPHIAEKFAEVEQRVLARKKAKAAQVKRKPLTMDLLEAHLKTTKLGHGRTHLPEVAEKGDHETAQLIERDEQRRLKEEQEQKQKEKETAEFLRLEWSHDRFHQLYGI